MNSYTFTLNLDGEFGIRTISEKDKATATKRVLTALVNSGIAKSQAEAKNIIISCTKE